MTEPVIIEATISNRPTNLFDPMPEVSAKFSDGTTSRLFTFYPDEIDFVESEFVGFTAAQAHALRVKKDLAYLQSSPTPARGIHSL